jgi:hypothetical protein
MPDVREHLGQARHNETFFAEINPDSYGDWSVTVLFYSALQLGSGLRVNPPAHVVQPVPFKATAQGIFQPLPPLTKGAGRYEAGLGAD